MAFTKRENPYGTLVTQMKEINRLRNNIAELKSALKDNDRLRTINTELADALQSMLNLESDATYGALRRAEANPTHYALDVAYHCDKARAAIAKATSCD